MEVVSITALLLLVAALSLLSLLFPGLNLLTIFNPNRKYFYKAVFENNQLILKGFRVSLAINPREIEKLSTGGFALRTLLGSEGMLSVSVKTINDTFYVFQGPLNIFAPGMSRELISHLKTANPAIELDSNLKTYSEKSLADMYINKEQAKRGLILLVIVLSLIIIPVIIQKITQGK